METSWYNISFDFEGVHYEGRVTPETKTDHAKPSSWHVVLNDVFFGYVHKDHDKWLANEQRPSGLVQVVGRIIEQPGHQLHTIE